MIRALVVDDRPDSRYLLRSILEAHGFEVEEAEHGAQALALARAVAPQIVISDLLMPVMDGYTLLRRWKADERLRAIPFVVATATYDSPQDRKLARDLGADAYLLKPIEPGPFMQCVRALLAVEARPAARAARALPDDEEAVLRQYSEVLVHRLERTAAGLEQANRLLREDIARREIAEAENARLLAQAAHSRRALLSIIEDEQEARDALRASEAKLRKLIDGLGQDMFVGLLTTEGIVVEANRPALAAAGLAPEDVIGKAVEETPWFAGSPHARSRIVEAVARAAAGEASRFDLQILVAGGRSAWLDFSMQPMRDEAGDIAYLVPSALVIEDRKRAELALHESTARSAALARRLLEIQESERRAVARELHDEVGGALTAVKLNLQSLQRKLGGRRGGEAVTDGLALVNGAIGSVRALSLDLRPAVLDDMGLVPALRWYCTRQAQRAGVVIECALDAIDLKETPQLESACYRIIQEAVTNALRHGNARRIGVALRRDSDGFALEVADDGCGFDPAGAQRRGLAGESSGLLGMQERARLAGGRLCIDSAPGAGTRVQAEFTTAEAGA